MWETKRKLKQEIETLNQKLNSKERSLNWRIDNHAKLERTYNRLVEDNKKLQNLLDAKQNDVARAIQQMNDVINRADTQTERFVKARRQLLDELEQARRERNSYIQLSQDYKKKYDQLLNNLIETKIDHRF